MLSAPAIHFRQCEPLNQPGQIIQWRGEIWQDQHCLLSMPTTTVMAASENQMETLREEIEIWIIMQLQDYPRHVEGRLLKRYPSTDWLLHKRYHRRYIG